MRRRSRKQKLVAEINITPFTDVILVLLIIFMITTPLIAQSSIKVKLPKASHTKAVDDITKIEITVTNEGTVYLGKQFVSRDELKKKIVSFHEDNPEAVVILRSDRFVRFQDIVSVLDLLNDADIHNINVAATNEE